MSESRQWMVDAVCVAADAETFFPRSKGDQPVEARRICDTCPVAQNCLDYALDTGQRDGVWGGTTHRERGRLGYRDRWAA